MAIIHPPSLSAKIGRILAFCVTAFLIFQFISVYLSWQKQSLLAVASILTGLIINRLSPSRYLTAALMLLSIAATFRYGWWRVHVLIDYFSVSANRHIGPQVVLMLVLLSAEVYTAVIMVLGYLQTIRPLERRPIPMPPEARQWPHVDILIPTYNEPLAVVRYTALAALNVDYPPEKLHIYILDDGTREDFEEFCFQAGVGYITRPTHPHAKAGNINHALEAVSSPYIAIFDCDHVPTRSFLQMTLGWFLRDQKLAMLQTPHYFYSPDPFERNLLQYKTIPNEGELFYGIIQDGNDLWNATFFCGSCAVIRRSALDEIGGIAVETVTEDAHTSLRLQRKGYNTAYINIPLAAGLATETLAAHVGQRVRWARGMIQILRVDNPLFGKGLNLTQRLCYFVAMCHFLYAVPRIIFLLAPLTYLLLRISIIPGYWVAILAYAMPHLFLATLTNSRVQSWHRHSFWNEIYETVLAPHILLPTVLAFINPKLGKFNVTAKGGTLAKTWFDRKISAPTRWLLVLNFLGLLIAPYRLLVTDRTHAGAICMNVAWIVFNIVILGVAAAVAYEQRQLRSSVRIEANIAIRIDLPGGRQIDAETVDMSVGGALIGLPKHSTLPPGTRIAVSFPTLCGENKVPAEIQAATDSAVRVAFYPTDIVEQETLARALYSRADAWIREPRSKEVDRPWISLGRVMVLSGHGLYQWIRSVRPPKRADETVTPASTTVALLLLAVTAVFPGRVWAAGAQPPAVKVTGTGARQNAKPADQSEAESNEVPTVRQLFSFRDLNGETPIEMHGEVSYYSVHVTLPHSMVPQKATLKLVYSLDPALDVRNASLRIQVNGFAVSAVTLQPGQGSSTAEIEIPERLLVRNSILTFEFVGSGAMQSEPEAKQHVFCRILPDSSLEISGAHLHMERNLGRLPLPFFDNELQTVTEIPFVFLKPPDSHMLQAAGIAASWTGVQAQATPPRITASVGKIPEGNAIIFATRAQLPVEWGIPPGNGPLIALRSNPTDSFGNLLIVAGDDGAQLLTAASTLAMTAASSAGIKPPLLTGDTAQPGSLSLPPARDKDDAPRWMQAGALNPIAVCNDKAALRTDGSSPIPVYFHVPPDLFYGEELTVNLAINYRYDASQVAPGSALRTYVNDNLVNETALPPGQGIAAGQELVLVPVANLQPFGNTLRFSFDFIRAHRGPSQYAQPSGSIGCDSTLDLRGLNLWTVLPNLKLFATAGFPFTQRADLAQTVVVLPTQPEAGEIALFLQLMSHFGRQTGYPALRVSVADSSTTLSPGFDYLILGSIGNQPAFDALRPQLPVAFDRNGRIEVKPRRWLRSAGESVLSMNDNLASFFRGIPAMVLDAPRAGDAPDALIEQIRSPASSGRSVVIIAFKRDADAAAIAAAFLEPKRSRPIAGSLNLMHGSDFKSYRADANEYYVGDISWYTIMRIYISHHFLLLLLLVILMCLVLARSIDRWVEHRAQERLKLAASTETR